MQPPYLYDAPSAAVVAGGASTFFADHALARRLEGADALNARACAEVRAGTAVLEAGGGFAVFVGAESPLTHAIGVGMNGAVRRAELDAIETFFRARGARPSFDLAPMADAELFVELGQRGYRVTEFNNVLVKRMPGFEIAFTPRVRRAVEDEGDLWSHTLGHAFFDKSELTTDEMDIGRDLFFMPGGLCYLAAVEGEIAAGAAMAVHSGLATLFADGTVARFRARGLHRELILARLNEAAALGCDMATASTLPGSQSQRDYERLGFQVAYTKVTLAG